MANSKLGGASVYIPGSSLPSFWSLLSPVSSGGISNIAEVQENKDKDVDDSKFGESPICSL